MNTKSNFCFALPSLKFVCLFFWVVGSAGPRFLPSAEASIENSEETDVDLMDYDAIVRELHTASAPEGRSRTRGDSGAVDPMATVLFHGGVGFASTVERIRHGGQKIDMHQQGIQAAFGIDLFSDHWLAEGTARSFGGADYGQYNVSLKEFDLKLYYRDRLSSKLGFRLGAGLSARYLRVSDGPGQAGFVYTTPASVAVAGLEYYVLSGLSIGAELSSRNAMIAETSDKHAADATLRIDAHF